MQTYKITDPESGRIIKITGERVPTEQELNDIFARVRGQQPQQEQQPQPQGVGQRVAKVAKEGIAAFGAPYSKEAARVVAPMARPALEVGGALAGGLAGGAGTVGVGALAGAGLGYAGGRQVADLIEQRAGLQQPKGVGQELLETAKDIGTGAAMEATGGIVAKPVLGALKYAGSVAPRLYESVAKIPPRSVTGQGRKQMIETAMKYGIAPTQKGLSKLQNMIEGVNEKIAGVINNSEKFKKDGKEVIKIDSIAKRLDSVKEWAKKSYADPAPVYKMVDDYKLGVTGSRGAEISVVEAQDLKQGIYRRLKDSAYGEYSTPQKEIDKQFARGIKEELLEKYPQLQALNAKDSALIRLEKELEKSVNRTRNRDIMGLADYGGTIGGAELAGGPGAAAGAITSKILRSPAIMANLSFALNKASKKAGVPIASRAIGYPIGKAVMPSNEQIEQTAGNIMGAMATPAEASRNIPTNAGPSPLNQQSQTTPRPSRLIPENKLSLGLYQDAQKAYLAGDYDTALTYFKQLVREDPKRSVIYKKAIDQINSEKENLPYYTMRGAQS